MVVEKFDIVPYVKFLLRAKIETLSCHGLVFSLLLVAAVEIKVLIVLAQPLFVGLNYGHYNRETLLGQ